MLDTHWEHCLQHVPVTQYSKLWIDERGRLTLNPDFDPYFPGFRLAIAVIN